MVPRRMVRTYVVPLAGSCPTTEAAPCVGKLQVARPSSREYAATVGGLPDPPTAASASRTGSPATWLTSTAASATVREPVAGRSPSSRSHRTSSVVGASLERITWSAPAATTTSSPAWSVSRVPAPRLRRCDAAGALPSGGLDRDDRRFVTADEQHEAVADEPAPRRVTVVPPAPLRGAVGQGDRADRRALREAQVIAERHERRWPRLVEPPGDHVAEGPADRLDHRAPHVADGSLGDEVGGRHELGPVVLDGLQRDRARRPTAHGADDQQRSEEHDRECQEEPGASRHGETLEPRLARPRASNLCLVDGKRRVRRTWCTAPRARQERRPRPGSVVLASDRRSVPGQALLGHRPGRRRRPTTRAPAGVAEGRRWALGGSGRVRRRAAAGAVGDGRGVAGRGAARPDVRSATFVESGPVENLIPDAGWTIIEPMIDTDRIDELDGNDAADALVAVRDELRAAEAKRLLHGRALGRPARRRRADAGWSWRCRRRAASGRVLVLPGCERMVPAGADGTPEIEEFAAAELAALLGAVDRGRGAADRRRDQPAPPAPPRVGPGAGTARCRCGCWSPRSPAGAPRPGSPSSRRGGSTPRPPPTCATLPPGRFLNLVEAKIIAADPTAAEERAREAALARFVRTGQTDEHGLRTLVARASAGDIVHPGRGDRPDRGDPRRRRATPTRSTPAGPPRCGSWPTPPARWRCSPPPPSTTSTRSTRPPAGNPTCSARRRTSDPGGYDWRLDPDGHRTLPQLLDLRDHPPRTTRP